MKIPLVTSLLEIISVVSGAEPVDLDQGLRLEDKQCLHSVIDYYEQTYGPRAEVYVSFRWSDSTARKSEVYSVHVRDVGSKSSKLVSYIYTFDLLEHPDCSVPTVQKVEFARRVK